MPRLITIRNLFEPHKRDIREVPVGARLIDVAPADVPADACQIIHGGAVVHDPGFWSHTFTEGDEVIIRVVPKGIGEAIFLGGATIWASIGTASVWSILGAIAVNLAIAAAISFGLSALINAVMSPAKSARTKNEDDSVTYGWDGIQNTMRNGEPIAMVYGRHRVGGQVLSVWSEAIADGKNELNMLIGLGCGPCCAVNGKTADTDALDSAAITDMTLNNTQAASFSGMTVSYRMGAYDQAVIPGFADQITAYSLALEVTSTAYTYTTVDNVQAIRVLLRCPNGLYRIDTRGNYLQYEVQHRVRYRQYGAVAWHDWETITLSTKTRTAYNAQHTIDLPCAGRYEVQIERVTDADGLYTVSSTYLIGVHEINRDDVAYNGVALVGLRAIASEQLNGAMPVVTSVVHGREVVVYRPGDDFGADTQQTFAADGQALWGWNALNIANATLAATNDYADRTLSIVHTTTATEWNGSTATGPFTYKEVTGDFVCSVRGAIAGGMTDDTMAMLLVQSPDDTTDWLFIGQWHDGSAYHWQFRHCTDGTNTDSTNGSATEDYYRITRVGSVFTCYTSSDGVTWTQRAQVTRTDMPSTVRLGCASSTPGNTTGTHRANFTSFTFTDSTCYSVECTSNPAWVIYDMLTSPDVGMGNHIDIATVDTDEFISFGDYCNGLVSDGAGGVHRRHCCDIVIDSVTPAWDLIQTIARNARAAVIYSASTVRPVWQCAKTAVQMFTMGNIVRGSFRTTYQTAKLGPNIYEVQYLNEEADYEQDNEQYIDTEIEAGEPYRRETVQGYGITRRAEAYREARFHCKSRQLRTSVAFEAGIDAIACEPGDRVEVQFDTTQWGHGGRIVAATSTTVTLDQDLTLAAGTTYQVVVRHSDDTLETRTVTNSPGVTNVLNVGDAFTTTPAADELYAVGETSYVTKPFTVARIEKAGDLTCKLELIEYDEDLYDDSIETLDQTTYSELPDPRKIPADVSNVVLTERAQVEKDGTVTNVIDVSYSLPVDAVAADVYWRENGKTGWQFVGRGRGTSFSIEGGVSYGYTYDVALAAVGAWGAHKAPEGCPSATITIEGKSSAPPDVTGLVITRVGDILNVRWDAVDAPDLAGYEVRYGSSAWSTATLLATMVTTNEYNASNFAPGSQYFQVKAINRSGIYSDTACSVLQTVEGRLAENLVIDRDEVTSSWNGTKTHMTVNGSYLDLDSGQTTGTYETPELDCGAAVRSAVAVLLQATQADLAATWDDSTFTWDSTEAQEQTWSGAAGEEHLTVSLQFRYGNTSGSLGSYQTFVPGEYTARYFQFKVTVTVDSTAYGARLEAMQEMIDVPDYAISGRAVAIASSGTTTITFSSYGPGYNVVPKFVAVPNAGAAGDNVEIVSVTATAATVRYWNGAGTQVAGSCNFIARGY